MDDRPQYDEFDKYVQRLEEGMTEDAWNIPPESVWEHLESQLDKKRGRVVPIWWWSGLSLLILAIAWSIWHSKDAGQEVIAEKIGRIGNGNDVSTVVESKDSNSVSSQLDHAASTDNVNLVSKASTTISQQRNNGTQSSINHRPVSIDLHPQLKVLEALPKPTSSALPVEYRDIQHAINPLNRHDLATIPINRLVPELKVTDNKKSKIQTKRHRIELASQYQQKYIPNHDAALGSLSIRSLGIGMNVYKQTGENWMIGTGLFYHSATIASSYSLAVDYTPQGEFLGDDGHYHNVYSHSLPTIKGTAKLEHIFFRAPDDFLGEGEIIPFELRMKHSQETIQLPISLAYTRRWGSWGAQLSAHLLMDLTHEVQLFGLSSIMPHHPKVHHNMSKSLQQRAAIWYIDIGAALIPQLQYYFADNMCLGLSPVFRIDLLSSSLQQGSGVPPYGLGAQLSLQYQW